MKKLLFCALLFALVLAPVRVSGAPTVPEVSFIQSELWGPFLFGVRWVDPPLPTVGQTLEVWCTLTDETGLGYSLDMQAVSWENDGDIVWVYQKNFLGHLWLVVGCRGYLLDPAGIIVEQTPIARYWFVDYRNVLYFPLTGK